MPTAALTEPARRPRATRRLGRPALTAWDVGLVGAGNAAIVVGLWLRGGGLTGVHGTADALTSAGRIAGLAGAYLVLVELVLIARLPWLERAVGFDRLTVWHRRNGRVALSLLGTHAVLVTVGYALADRIGVPHEVGRLVTSYPGIITAVAGLALLIAVVVTSIVIVRRRLRYETWYFVHLYAYLGIALAFSHQLATGNDFTGDPVARDYWYVLYLGTLGALLAFRVGAPIAGALRHRLRVERVTREGPGVVSLHITGRRLDRLGARAGQFFLWRFLTRDRWFESHPFSLSAAPDGRSLRVTVKDLGDFSARLAHVAPGTRVIAEGPYGAFTRERRRRRRVALIAGGVGITPVRALLEDLDAAPGEVVVVYRAAAVEDLLFRDELAALAHERGAELRYVVGDHRHPAARGLLSAAHLRELIPDIARREVFLCGPSGMADATERSLRAAGVSRRHIHVERFAF